MTLHQDSISKNLDPADWDEARAAFHEAVDLCVDFMSSVRDRPVWLAPSIALKQSLEIGMPEVGSDLSALVHHVSTEFFPYVTGNIHPRFFGWVHGSGNAAGALGEMMAAFMNCNVGGRDHGAVYVERQVLSWFIDLFGLPKESSGILTSGTSMGTLIALSSARYSMVSSVNDEGLKGSKSLVCYASDEAHNCCRKALELLGLGRRSLRLLKTNPDYTIDLESLERSIIQDRQSGRRPMAVIASVGTVNTGAIDDLEGISRICRAHNVWMHADAAFGGLAMLLDEYRARLQPLKNFDSIAFDFHKWAHVPYDAGCVIIRDGVCHRSAFGGRPSYLASEDSGLAGGEPWFCDLGPELSRGFRALKVWMTIQALGTRGLTDAIRKNCQQASWLAERVVADDNLELCSLPQLNIVCFRFVDKRLPDDEIDRLNKDIVLHLQRAGLAAPSTTILRGRTVIRVNLTNHRTEVSDLHEFLRDTIRLGQQLVQDSRNVDKPPSGSE